MLNPDLIEIVTENPDTVISHQGIQAVCKTSASRERDINYEYYSHRLCYRNLYRRKLF